MIKPTLLTLAYAMLRAKNALRQSTHCLRVLMYHDIAPSEQTQFEAQLRFLSKKWNFVSATQFVSMLKGEQPIEGRNVLLTFDDGFLSNYHVAWSILRTLKIPALFFVSTDFINLTERDQQRDFVQNRLYLQGDSPHWKNMTWDHLRALRDQGHTIGSHTCSHADLSQVESESILIREIKESRDILEAQLQVKIEHFAVPYGRLEHMNLRAFSIAKAHYPYIYSGIRGNNIHYKHVCAIARDAISPQDPRRVVGAFLEGAVDRRYMKKLAQFSQMASSA